MPARIDFMPSCATSSRRSGTIAPMPPIMMPSSRDEEDADAESVEEALAQARPGARQARHRSLSFPNCRCQEGAEPKTRRPRIITVCKSFFVSGAALGPLYCAVTVNDTSRVPSTSPPSLRCEKVVARSV